MTTSRFAVLGLIAVAAAFAAGAAPPLPPPTPVVTMLVPGFAVRELPIDLTNINSLEYTPDGRLWALGYDGRVHILTDTDGDGVEDTAKTWWQPKDAKAFRGPIGLKVTKGGAYVASKGKISLLKDTDGDGAADTEEIIATGWREAFTAVDATGMALDKDGNVYWGLGCANFADAYQIDKQTKKSQYDIDSSHGTIQRLSADRSKREAVATGVRFAIGLAFNRHGDLFFTDQEGDTWTKGNHLDELNVLFPGRRHYGFPERHPEYLPNTDDEPPVVGFGPQHQSACGLKFNEPRDGWMTFGPKLWENDALVVGESRGKIWRVPLVKVREGYVGRPVPIAAISMLAIDVAVSPKGAMVVCCHSGPPDWGTGPTGKGKLFKITYVDEKAPQPVIAWPAARDEIRVAFDRPIDKAVESRMTGLTVSCGEYVRAADRLEVLRPPYAVVKAQMATPRREVGISSAKLSDDGRTLRVKLAEPMPWRGWYALAVPGVKAPGAAGLGEVIDVDFPMQGAAGYLNVHNAGAPRYPDTPWLAHIDPSVAVELARSSPQHDGLAAQLASAYLQADLQINAKLDLPGKEATLSFASSRPFFAQAQPAGSPVIDLKVERKTGDGYAGEIRVATGGGLLPLHVSIDVTRGAAPVPAPQFSITYTTDRSATPRPIPLDAILPPWAPTERQPVVAEAAPSLLTKGGDWDAGKALFFGEAKCGTCHTVGADGGRLGPNLSNLVHLNPESVLQDIVEPSARINPDHVNYIVETDSGDLVSGLVRQEDGEVIVYEAVDKTTRIERSRVKEIRPSKISLMPEGYKELGEAKLRDLLTFLTTERGKAK